MQVELKMEQNDEDGWGDELDQEELIAINRKRKQSGQTLSEAEDTSKKKKICVKMEVGAGDNSSSQDKSMDTACSEKSYMEDLSEAENKDIDKIKMEVGSQEQQDDDMESVKSVPVKQEQTTHVSEEQT